ncbi:hypothetical protein ACQZV8_11115 [Magnetococcales bacterium HHB-1]
MAISFEEVEKKYNEIIEGLEELKDFMKDFFHDKEKNRANDFPVYSIQGRVKDLGSLFLKVKRKQVSDIKKLFRSLPDTSFIAKKDLPAITDFIGMRLVCLYEQDIPIIHSFICAPSPDKRFPESQNVIYTKDKDTYKFSIHLQEVTINGERNQETEDMMDLARSHIVQGEKLPTFKEAEKQIKNHARDTGYRSIHYLLKIGKIIKNEKEIFNEGGLIELQLRTLMQDIWGSVTHDLAYKKARVPNHIHESFSQIARDFESADKRIRYLKELSDQDQAHTRFQNASYQPTIWIPLEGLTSKIGNKNIKSQLQEYKENMSQYNRKRLDEKWVAALYQKFNKLHDEILNEKISLDNSSKIKIELEEAFWLFLNQKQEEALKTYKRLEKEHKDSSIYFRMGEIFDLQEDHEQAIKNFDNCERHLDQILNKLPEKDKDSILVSVVRMNLALAKRYWTKGSEYFHLSLNRAEKAQQAFNLLSDNTSPKRIIQQMTILNNICWYNLELFLINRQNGCSCKSMDFYHTAKAALDKMRLDEETLYKIGGIDTAAWFYFNSYRYLKKTHHEEMMALKYAKKLRNMIQHSDDWKDLEIEQDHLVKISHHFKSLEPHKLR